MPGRLTVWGASQLLTTYFSQTTTPPPSLYLALVKDVAPTPYISGSELDEPDNEDYARVAIESSLAYWFNDSTPQEIYNAQAAAFTTAVTRWGKISYWALCNAQLGGYNMLVGDLVNPVIVEIGDQPVFSPSDLSITLGPLYLSEAE